MADYNGIDGSSQPVGRVLETDLRINSVSRNIFSIMRQSTATNKLATLKTADSIADADESDRLKIENGNLQVTLENFSTLGKGIKTTTHRLVDAIIVRFTETGSKDSTVFLSLDEYMKLCGLKNLKEIRKQVNSELKLLSNMKVTFNKSSNHEQSFSDIRICESVEIKNNIICFRFGQEFFRILKGMPVMPYPMKLFNLNNKRNPNSYYFLKKIAEHKKMNYFKKNSDTLSVKTLLESTPELPSYDEVVNGDRAVARRIIEPFERDMNELADVLTWEYCHTNGTVLSDDELDNFSYHIFYGLLVRVSWIDYPEIQKRNNKSKGG
ncbi:MAG: hypothetical protein Q4F95_08890 [Oscillospiraceae bacterium]|nr:hypothetical protein [Oscillospiraceae bacterium]